MSVHLKKSLSKGLLCFVYFHQVWLDNLTMVFRWLLTCSLFPFVVKSSDYYFSFPLFSPREEKKGNITNYGNRSWKALCSPSLKSCARKKKKKVGTVLSRKITWLPFVSLFVKVQSCIMFHVLSPSLNG